MKSCGQKGKNQWIIENRRVSYHGDKLIEMCDQKLTHD